VRSAAGGVPTGAVAFCPAGTTSGCFAQATLNGAGTATYTISSTVTGEDAVGAEKWIAIYRGDAHYLGSTSTVAMLTINRAQTITTLLSSANPATHGTPITLTATVRAAAPAIVVPIGSVTFMDGATALGTTNIGANGTAGLTISSLAVGTHNITAKYTNTDGWSTNSTSAALSQIIQ
jgi:hypothetical protein